MEQQTERQHFVPQFYLRNFTNPKGGFFCFDKVEQRRFPANVRNVAHEHFFYGIDPSLFPPEAVPPNSYQVIEQTLSQLEGHFSAAIRELLLKGEGEGISLEQRPILSHFIVLQLLRTREFRNTLRELQTKVAQDIGQRLVHLKEGQGRYRVKVEFDDSTWPLEQAKLMFDPAKTRELIRILNNHIWHVGVNETEFPFYTSDNPIVRQAHIDHPFLGGIGLQSPGVEIAVPLSPRIILILCHRGTFKRNEIYEGKPIQLVADNITHYNSLQVGQSNRYIYCSNDNFALVEQMCMDEPDLCRPDRTRIGTGGGSS